MANRRRPVICAVSGGVDSAVSLLRLKRSKEFEVRSALFMRNWDAREELDTTSKCTVCRCEVLQSLEIAAIQFWTVLKCKFECLGDLKTNSV